jgi:putative MATE family efflux protein
MLAVLKTPEEIMDASALYLIIVFLGTTGNLIYQMGTGALRGMGDVTWPLIFLVICSVLNIVFDLAAVLLFGLGVEGVAAATAISQIISGAGIIVRLNRGSYGIKVGLSEMKPDRYELGEIVRIGLPAAIQNIGNTLASMFVQSSVNTFGATFIAANSIVNKVDMLLYIPVDALSTALCTFVGQNMGRLQLDRIKKGINSAIATLTVLGVGLCAAQITFRHVLPMIFSKDRAVLDIASEGLFIMAFQCLFYGIDRCLVNAMRGAGKSVVPMITAQFGAFSRIPLSYYLGVKTGDWHGIFWAMLIAAFLRNTAIAVYYFCGGWSRVVRSYEEKHPELLKAKNAADETGI